MNAWVFVAFTTFLICHLWLFFRDRQMAMVKIGSSVMLLTLIALLWKGAGGSVSLAIGKGRCAV